MDFEFCFEYTIDIVMAVSDAAPTPVKADTVRAELAHLEHTASFDQYLQYLVADNMLIVTECNGEKYLQLGPEAQ